jgi:hypothetical protein
MSCLALFAHGASSSTVALEISARATCLSTFSADACQYISFFTLTGNILSRPLTPRLVQTALTTLILHLHRPIPSDFFFCPSDPFSVIASSPNSQTLHPPPLHLLIPLHRLDLNINLNPRFGFRTVSSLFYIRRRASSAKSESSSNVQSELLQVCTVEAWLLGNGLVGVRC